MDTRAVFLAGCETIRDAAADPAVAARWDEPSVLEDQRVGGLVGHLARGGVWVVADYLDAGADPAAVDCVSAADYFARLLPLADDAMHAGIRARGAEVGSVGPAELVATIDTRLAEIRDRLSDLPADRAVRVAGDVTMPLDRYLETRIVEQVVHLDDLARSVGREPWVLPDDAVAVALTAAVEMARRRHGDAALLRALYRRGFAEGVLPVF